MHEWGLLPHLKVEVKLDDEHGFDGEMEIPSVPSVTLNFQISKFPKASHPFASLEKMGSLPPLHSLNKIHPAKMVIRGQNPIYAYMNVNRITGKRSSKKEKKRHKTGSHSPRVDDASHPPNLRAQVTQMKVSRIPRLDTGADVAAGMKGRYSSSRLKPV